MNDFCLIQKNQARIVIVHRSTTFSLNLSLSRMSGGAWDAAAAVANDAAPAKKKVKKNGRQSGKNTTLRVTIGLITCGTVSVMAVFVLGCILRIVMLSKTGLLPLNMHDGIAAPINPAHPLPEPADIISVSSGPYTTYTSKTFQANKGTTSHSSQISLIGGDAKDANIKAISYEGSTKNHLPAGYHLLVDIKGVDPAFLNTEKSLVTAMVELVKDSKLTLLSYHCHSLMPMGVSCVGVDTERHFAFHTWPKEGVIVIDLFTSGDSPLVPVLPSIQKLFAISHSQSGGEDERDIPAPTTLWSHKLRGFRKEFATGYDLERDPYDSDMGRFVLGQNPSYYQVKELFASVQTPFQAFDVYGLMYEPKSESEIYPTDRVLFLDGVIQSTLFGDAPYHESIVHPAMITHPNPKRVAIIGGGEGATLREVLKHSTVEEAVMIEIDEVVVKLSREHLPEWQDCSIISHHEKAAEWCFDDARASTR